MLDDDDTPEAMPGVMPVTRSGQEEQAYRALTGGLELVEHGYRLSPVTITRGPNGKKNAQFHGRWRHESAWSSDPEQIKAWWADHPQCSFAIGGAANGIEGVDLDVKPAQGVDAVTWWSERLLPLSPFVQWTPSGGLHSIWRVRADGLALPQEAGKSLGIGIDTRNRSGLFFAAGGYVVGEEGHYTTAGTLPKLEDLDETPREVIELFADAAAKQAVERPADGRIITHDLEWQRLQIERAVTAIRSHHRDEGGYRAKIQHLGLMFGRVVEQGLVTAEYAEGQWRDAHASVWGAAVWPENVKTFRDALRDGPMKERWRVPTERPSIIDRAALGLPPVQEPAVTRSSVQESGSTQSDIGWSEDPAAQLERKLANEIERQDLRELATRARAERDRKPLRRMSATEFLAAPQPTYLVPGLLYMDSLAVVFGPPGAAKTFFTLDLALSLATGRAWRGEVSVPRTRVHYLMAEGQAVNVGRTLAWLHHHGVDGDELDGWFDPFPEPISLTPEGVGGYLREVETDKPGLIILDTKHAMMEGDESKAADVKVMRDALTMLRAGSGACVLLVDHTGLNDLDRARGSNSQKAMVATEIKLVDNNGVRTAEIVRNTAGAVEGSWSFELKPVEDAPRPPGTAVPVVPVPAGKRAVEAALRDSFWDIRRDELPLAVAALGGAAGDAACDMFRALVAANDQDGLTVSQLWTLIKESERKHSRTQAYAGASKLIEHGVLDKAVGGGKSYVLALRYRDWNADKAMAERRERSGPVPATR
jgi:hypothetical protein